MIQNYDYKVKVGERSGKFFLSYILDRMAGNKEPLKSLMLSSQYNAPGTLMNSVQGKIHSGIADINVQDGQMSMKINAPLGTSGMIEYISLISGTDTTGQIVETFKIQRVDKLDIVEVEITIILIAYDN